MGACETTPATSREPGKARQATAAPDNPAAKGRAPLLAPDHRPPLGGVKLVRPRRRALRAHRPRALQLDPRPRDSTNPAATRKRGNSSPQPGGQAKQVTGAIQHCPLTRESPMGAISGCRLAVRVALVAGVVVCLGGAEGVGDALVSGGRLAADAVRVDPRRWSRRPGARSWPGAVRRWRCPFP